jgi:hypothetical protein
MGHHLKIQIEKNKIKSLMTNTSSNFTLLLFLTEWGFC